MGVKIIKADDTKYRNLILSIDSRKKKKETDKIGVGVLNDDIETGRDSTYISWYATKHEFGLDGFQQRKFLRAVSEAGATHRKLEKLCKLYAKGEITYQELERQAGEYLVNKVRERIMKPKGGGKSVYDTGALWRSIAYMNTDGEIETINGTMNIKKALSEGSFDFKHTGKSSDVAFMLSRLEKSLRKRKAVKFRKAGKKRGRL